jgi:nicotinate-nucleotide--dimethylbenzimidazole phosphoribosyltransferase
MPEHCGFYLQATALQVAVVLDSFVSQAAALVAVALSPAVKGYLFASRGSRSLHGDKRLARLGVTPIFDFSLWLGEGTGAALVLPVIEGAAALLAEMATFAEVGFSESLSQRPE